MRSMWITSTNQLEKDQKKEQNEQVFYQKKANFIANKYMKRCSIFLVKRETHIKTMR